jgi:hypothetical protein
LAVQEEEEEDGEVVVMSGTYLENLKILEEKWKGCLRDV